MGTHRPDLPVQRYLATCDQYQYNHHHVPHGVSLIQNTQNRDTEALQIKLDELIRSKENAHSVLLDLEELDDEEIDLIRKDYLELAKKSQGSLEAWQKGYRCPRIVRSRIPAIAPEFEKPTGKFLYRGKAIEAPAYAYDREAQQRLWTLVKNSLTWHLQRE